MAHTASQVLFSEFTTKTKPRELIHTGAAFIGMAITNVLFVVLGGWLLPYIPMVAHVVFVCAASTGALVACGISWLIIGSIRFAKES